MDQPSNNKIILIVEDEISQRKALAETFLNNGFDVLEAKDGVEGLNIAFKEKPDIILLDILMPEMDGMAMLKKLRHENLWGENIPVILLTNISPDDETINKGVIEDRPSYYLMKANCAVDDIVSKVKELVEK